MKKIVILSVALFFIGCSVEQRNLDKAKKLIEAYMFNNMPNDAQYAPIAYLPLDSLYGNAERDLVLREIDKRYEALRDSLEKEANKVRETDLKHYFELSDMQMATFDQARKERERVYADTKFKNEFSGWLIMHKYKNSNSEFGYSFACFWMNKDLTIVEDFDSFDEDAREYAKYTKDSINTYLARKDNLTAKEKRRLEKLEQELAFIMK